MQQSSFFPEPIRLVTPNPVPSVDSPGIGEAFSGQRYVLKVATPAMPGLPASEWIATELARAMNLAVPVPTVCLMPDGSLAYGSRMEGDVTATRFDAVGRPDHVQNPGVVSVTWVLDMFLANNDRHPGNWIETQTAGVRLLRPIDFSRALLFRYPLPPPRFQAWENSGRFYAAALAFGTIDRTEALDALRRLRTMPKARWSHAVNGVPDVWLPDWLRRELVNWWYSPMWHHRMQQLEQAI